MDKMNEYYEENEGKENPINTQTNAVSETASQTNPSQEDAQDLKIDSKMLQTILTQNNEMIKSMSALIQTLSITKTTKVIPPGKYQQNGGETLYQFLERFEYYCSKSFPGSSEGMLPLLGSYLEGPVLKVYQTVVKGTYDYGEAKSKLLQWYREEVVKDKKREVEKFMEAKMEKNETASVYALRLEGLARRAFPGVDVQTMPLVRKRFLDSLSHQIKQQVESTLTTVETTFGMQVSWDRLVAIVDANIQGSVQKDNNEKSPEVIDLTSSTPINRVTTAGSGNCCCGNSVYYHSVAPGEAGPIGPRGNNGHDIRNSNKGAIPKTQPQKFPRREWTPSFYSKKNEKPEEGQMIICGFCKKRGHSMEKCRARPFCQFCGKRGHVFDDCFIAKNQCLFCKQKGHLVQNCPTKNNFSLSCPLCKGEHLGKDCTAMKEN